jgi:hypothetical protein
VVVVSRLSLFKASAQIFSSGVQKAFPCWLLACWSHLQLEEAQAAHHRKPCCWHALAQHDPRVMTHEDLAAMCTVTNLDVDANRKQHMTAHCDLS